MFEHAKNELVEWLDKEGKYCDESQKNICVAVLYILESQTKEVKSKMCEETLVLLNSTSNAGGAGEKLIKLFEKLANFEPLSEREGFEK